MLKGILYIMLPGFTPLPTGKTPEQVVPIPVHTRYLLNSMLIAHKSILGHLALFQIRYKSIRIDTPIDTPLVDQEMPRA